MMTHHSFEASGFEIWNTCTICDRRAEWPEVNVISDVSNQHDCAADASLTSLIVIGSIYGFSWRGRKNMLNMSSLTAKEKQCLHSPIAIIHRNYIQDHCIFLVFFCKVGEFYALTMLNLFLTRLLFFFHFNSKKYLKMWLLFIEMQLIAHLKWWNLNKITSIIFFIYLFIFIVDILLSRSKVLANTPLRCHLEIALAIFLPSA